MQQRSSTVEINRFFHNELTTRSYGLSALKSRKDLDKIWPYLFNICHPIQPFELGAFTLSPGRKLAVMGLPNLSTLEIACQLKPAQKKNFPQVFIVDNNAAAENFWKTFKSFVLQYSKAQSFLKNLENFLRQSAQVVDLEKSLLTDACAEFAEIFKRIDFSYFCSVLSNSKFMRRDWRNSETFAHIKEKIPPSYSVVVLAAFVVSISTLSHARQLLADIYSLKPFLTIHTNKAIYKEAPDANIFLPGEQNEPENALRALINKVSYVGYKPKTRNGKEFSTHAAYTRRMYDEMHHAIIAICVQQDSRVYSVSEFLLAYIFHQAKCELGKAESVALSNHNESIFFYFNIALAEQTAAIQKLRLAFGDDLHFGAASLGEIPDKPGLLAIGVKMPDVIKNIIPKLARYLQDNPDLVVSCHKAFAVVQYFVDFFAQYDMSAAESDCFEETLFNVVNWNLQAAGEAPKNFTSKNNVFSANDEYFHIYINDSVENAQAIAAYFNAIMGESASVSPWPCYVVEKDILLTKITIQHNAITEKKFCDDLVAMIMSYTKEQKLPYRSRQWLQAEARAQSRKENEEQRTPEEYNALRKRPGR